MAELLRIDNFDLLPNHSCNIPMRAIVIEIFEYDGWIYEHYDYGHGQHTYSKTKNGNILPRNSEKYEFNKAKLYGEKVKTTIRKAS